MGQILPFDMFDVERSASEARRFSRMGKIYHRGQKLIWDGQAVLDELWKTHGGTGLSEQQKPSAQRLLGSIMWGELAAWKIAARLADDLVPLEARMAATSQAHDEARHFYVMHDYLLRATGDFPRTVSKPTEALLSACMDANTPAKRVIGMQLQLETTALTVFHALRESQVCPVLTDLLLYYEKDEARHVGLGTQILPTMMESMSLRQRFEFSAFSFRVAYWSIVNLKATEDDFVALGIDPRRVAILGKSKQMMVFEELWQVAPGTRSALREQFGRTFDALCEGLWPEADVKDDWSERARRVWSTFKDGLEQVETVLDPSQPARKTEWLRAREAPPGADSQAD